MAASADSGAGLPPPTDLDLSPKLEDMRPASCLDAARRYLASGLCVLPASLQEKRPDAGNWGKYKDQLPSAADLQHWFRDSHVCCLITGPISGNLEILDFDLEAEAFGAWSELIEEAIPGLLATLVIERSQSGGRHVAYRSVEPVCGNRKLAEREVETPNEDPVKICGKTYIPQQRGDSWVVRLTIVESKGQGGACLCDPSPGYVLEQGDFTCLPVLTAEQREILLEAAWSFHELVPDPEPCPQSGGGDVGNRPGDDFNARGDIRPVLRRHGWELARPGENEYWRRPGKTQGWSATLKGGVFYVFSSNAAPFAPQRAYSPFSAYTQLEHGGDYSRAASALFQLGYGSRAPESCGDLPPFGIPRTSQPPADLEGSPIPGPQFRSVLELATDFPSLRRPILHGLLREGETMNIISAPKAGKSWLVTDLALAVATGRPWLECFPTELGEVLILDNELHCETSAHRVPQVAAARGIRWEEVGGRIFIDNLRGRLQDLFALGPYFEALEPGRFQLIILDAFYRFMPLDKDENDNGTMAHLYNYLDHYAHRQQCSFVLIHHASKGNQSGKSLTDVGAGSQSRATDTHLVLRPHEQDGCVVLDAAVRSWPPVAPLCLRWEFPVWLPDNTLDPAALRQERPRRRAPPEPRIERTPEPPWTPERFVEAFVGTEPRPQWSLIDVAMDSGVPERRAISLFRRAVAKGLLYRWPCGPDRSPRFAREPPPRGAAAQRDRGAVQRIGREAPARAGCAPGSTRPQQPRRGHPVRGLLRVRAEAARNALSG